MQTALQRPSSHPQHSQFFSAGRRAFQQPGSMSVTWPSRAGSGGGGVQGLVVGSVEDSDNIDDILKTLWPTDSMPLATAALKIDGQPQSNRVGGDRCFRHTGSRPPSHQFAGSGHHTPPENDAHSRIPFSMAMLPPQTQKLTPPPATSSAYALVSTPVMVLNSTPSLRCSQNKGDVTFAHSSIPGNGRLMTRSVSSSIQIGDPEWRVDSPQSTVHASPMYMRSIDCCNASGKLPSPVSPTMHVPALPNELLPMQYRRESSAAAMRSQPASLGIGSSSSTCGIRTSRSASTLGLLPRSTGAQPASVASASPRRLTPEERVARLHTVSGLAARAVARRCLSGQLPALDADAMLRLPGAVAGSTPSALAAANRKLTFADVARGSQAQPQDQANGNHYDHR